MAWSHDRDRGSFFGLGDRPKSFPERLLAPGFTAKISPANAAQHLRLRYTYSYLAIETALLLMIAMSNPLLKFAYQTLQDGKSYFSLAHKALSTQLRQTIAPPKPLGIQAASPQLLMKFRERLAALHAIDWEDAERGVYPVELLFDEAWSDFLTQYPQVWLDMPSVWERADNQRYQEVATQFDTAIYPKYYVQNFHHQTDGYLSDRSANLYDVQVDLLFNGAADAMRRRVLAPLKRGLAPFSSLDPRAIRVLDVACGTGRTLKNLRAMLPQASLYGVDLSAPYLRKANQMLSQIPGELPQLIQANAETLPYADRYFHGLTCVFLFHELPAQARQNVLNECFRVLQPGGVLVICDSMQLKDSPEFAPFMANFPLLFHEPYYRDYVQDDLTQRLQEAGFICTGDDLHLASKYLIAQKPSEAVQAAIAEQAEAMLKN